MPEEELDPSFYLNVSDEREINDFLFITDILITDYSSVIFEASLLDIKTIFLFRIIMNILLRVIFIILILSIHMDQLLIMRMNLLLQFKIAKMMKTNLKSLKLNFVVHVMDIVQRSL